MKRVVWASLFFCGFLVIKTAAAANFYPFHGWRTIETKNFSIHYHHRLEEIAKRAGTYFEEVHTHLSKKYEWKPWGKTQVILTDTNDEANGLASTLPYNWILLRVVAPQPESSLNYYNDWLKTLITHEYTHILHLDAYGGFWKPFHYIFGKLIAPAGLTPGWVREGTATLEETLGTEGGRGRSATTEMFLRTAILQNQFPTIDRADGVHWKWPSGQTQYLFGVKFLEFLKDHYGEEKLQAFHRKTQRFLLMGAVNTHARKIFGKSFPKLWKDWQEELKEKYAHWEKSVGENSFTKLEPFLEGKENFYLPTYSPDGKQLAYVSLSPKRSPFFLLKDLESGVVKRLSKKSPLSFSFSPEGGKIIFSLLSSYKRYHYYYDLYELDLATLKQKRLTRGHRARDPHFHPNGEQILFVSGDPMGDHIEIYDVKTKESHAIIERVPSFAQFAHPRFSPDGSQFSVVRYLPSHGWELCLYQSDGKFLRSLTKNGLAVESRPVWTPDGKGIVYASDEDGVNNFYLYDLVANRSRRLTRVKTGLFQPALSPDGKTLLGRYYNGEGFDVRKVPFNLEHQVEIGGPASRLRSVSPEGPLGPPARLSPPISSQDSQQNETTKKYSPFGKSLFLPRYLLPGFYLLDNGLLVSAATGGSDPLRYHNWFGGMTYRTDAKHVGYFGQYFYNRFRPIFGVGIDDGAVDFGVLTFTRTGNSYHFYEERRRFSTFFSIPIGKKQGLGASYFYEDRIPITNILSAEAGDLNLGIYSGFHFSYVFGQREAYPASISPTEKGRILRLTGTITDSSLGSNQKNEQRIFAGDFREYIALGLNHVLALRMAGGIALGDRIFPGTFSLGGALGEGVLAGQASSRYFSLRGLPVGSLIRDRVMLSSAEYRLPLVSPQRGLGTAPLFLNNLHLGFFADYGDAWDSRDRRTKNDFKDFFDDFFLGVGLELRADLVIGHGLPLTGRLGYARIVVNRDRLGSLKDPFLGNKVKDGMFILQFGTPF